MKQLQDYRKKSKFPPWLRKKLPNGKFLSFTRQTLREARLNTVCENSLCPNIHECFSKKKATFLILGEVCSRGCGFCGIRTGSPEAVDKDEPNRLAEASVRLGLGYVIVTSVTRDDLEDGGAFQFADCIDSIRSRLPEAKIEVLVPDFKGSSESVKIVIDKKPDVFAHNMETVRRLYPLVRNKASYSRSLDLLRLAKEIDPDIKTKSGFMLGLGEKKEDVIKLMEELKVVGVDILTIGQYLSPSDAHFKPVEYVKPEQFNDYADIARKMGFGNVASAPFVRSSYVELPPL